ncbi:MAG: ABC transporter substrate-binding protein [Clostridia bacterium]|nr:ABC transporter substrate-binding protein [Clostridia bacterium]
MRKILIMILMFIVLIGCSEKTIKVGVIADLSTKNSQLGIDARNAVILLVDQVNEKGGINGKKIELIVKDDESNLESAKIQHEDFMSEKVHLIIGHLTSNMAEVMVETNSNELMFIAPSISTDSLTQIDDYILRTSPINSNQAKVLSDYLLKHDIQEFIVVYDLHNKEYTEDLVNKLVESYEDENHHIILKLPYDSSEDALEDVVKKININNDSHILFVSQATDTAFFLQYLRKDNPNFKSYSVSWSMTNDLIQKGGPSVENTIFVGVRIPETETDSYKTFKDTFENRFG